MASLNTAEVFGKYDFGLSQEEEERAARLHEESIIIDMLFQGPCGYRAFTSEMEAELQEEWNTQEDYRAYMALTRTLPGIKACRGELDDFRQCWEESGITAGARVVFLDSFEGFVLYFGGVIAEFDHLPWLIKALRAEDIRRAKAEGKMAGFVKTQFISTVGLVGLNPLRIIEPAYNIGLRMLQLTYNHMNFIGSGCAERTDAGVSNLGKKLIGKMNEIGIIVDTSHCGRQTTLDACKLSKAPVVASHTTAKNVYMHIRGKTDEEIRAIADSSGVIGVLAIPFILGPGPKVNIETMLDHIDYIVNLVGWEHVGIGTDWPLQMPKSILKETMAKVAAEWFKEGQVVKPEVNLEGFDDYRDFPNITRGLVRRGYSDKETKGILGENFLRVFETVCG